MSKKKLKVLSISIAILAISLPLILTACAQTSIPLSTTPKQYAQDKIQAADHWDTIANGVALRVQKTLEDRPDLIGRPLYIAPPGEGVFLRSFASLLRSRLVSKGMQVSEHQEPSSLIIRYNVQTVLHDSSRGDYGLSLAGLGIGIANAVGGGYTSTSDHEIIINTTMTANNRYAMSLSQICYISDADWDLYLDPMVLTRQGESADSIWERYASRGQAFSSDAGGIKAKPLYVDNIRRDKMLSGASAEMDTSRSYGDYYDAGSGSSYGPSYGESSSISVSPIIEEYVMMPGGQMINPDASPRPIGRARR